MDRIASFSVDHTVLKPGLYVSRVDGDIVTYDLRVCEPYSGNLLGFEEMHTMEHLIATIVRNNKDYSGDIVYFGPMGCQTGFYLLVNKLDWDIVKGMLIDAMKQVIDWSDEVPGNSKVECGNYTTLNLEAAKKVAFEYLKVLESAYTPNYTR